MANISTSQEREQAFILLFEKSFNSELSSDEIIGLAADNEYVKVTSYAEKLFVEACDKLPVIDTLITSYLKGWEINRLSKVCLAVLRLAFCEIRYFDKVPNGVTINDAVEICKKYASEDEYQFVNGVLGAFAKDGKK